MGKLRKNNKTFSSVWDAIANTPEQAVNLQTLAEIRQAV